MLPSLRTTMVYWIVSPGDAAPLSSASTTTVARLVARSTGVAATVVVVGSSASAVLGSSESVPAALVELIVAWLLTCVTPGSGATTTTR